MTSLLLDTHAWIWLAAGDSRLVKHKRVLAQAARSNQLLLSSISVYEAALIGIETERGRRRGKQAVRMLPTIQQWIRDALAGTRVVSIPVEAETASTAALLESMHANPFDRLIAAAALLSGARLVTADAKLLEFAEQTRMKVFDV